MPTSDRIWWRRKRTKAANCVRREKPYAFKKKAHEEQASFNKKVHDVVEEARDALETATDSLAVQWATAALLP